MKNFDLKSSSLIEVLVSMAILSIISIMVFQVLNISDTLWHTDSNFLSLQQYTRQTMLGMTREIRQANNLTIPGSTQINFTIPGANGNFTNTISYYLSGDNIIRRHPSSTTRIIAKNVDDLTFCCWHGSTCDSTCTSSEIVEIRLKTKKTTPRQRIVYFNLTDEVHLRN